MGGLLFPPGPVFSTLSPGRLEEGGGDVVYWEAKGDLIWYAI